MTDEETLIFDRGDVVYDDDPFKGEEDARPSEIRKMGDITTKIAGLYK